MKVTWDEAKNTANQKKHGVSFEEARALLARDEGRLDIFDEAHSSTEDRFISIGPIVRGLVLVVWTERLPSDHVRIISARWATRRENALYQAHVRGDL